MSSSTPQISICPCLGSADEAGSSQSRPSAQHRCFSDGAPLEVSFRRQTASCLTAGHARCSRFLERWSEEEPEEPRGGRSLGAFDSTLAEGALVLVMAGMIAFALFAIAPRPAPVAFARDAQPPAAEVASGNQGNSATVAASAVTAATATPAPTVAPTAVPARVPAATPTPSRAKSYLVKAGDTIYSIARANGVAPDALAKANSLSDPKLLKVGQTLKIP